MNIYPLSYSIPDEYIVNEIPEKKHVVASLIPGFQKTYVFLSSDEDKYHDMYKKSIFGITKKKGGWDCLRHYEILANGCVPIFEKLDECPEDTLTTFPKKLVRSFIEDYNNGYNIKQYADKILEHTKKYCTTSYSAEYFMSKYEESTNIDKANVKNILLITCNQGVNYTRETLWIGLKRYIQSINGVAVEYPKIPYLYNNAQTTDKLYGHGFGYAHKISDDYNFSQDEIIEKIKTHFWDMIIFGKVGPDELFEGTSPNFPLWHPVIENYNKNQIVFLYGGDERIDMTYPNRYRDHIEYHRQHGTCFVRELKR